MLQEVVKQIVAQYGEHILIDPKRVNAFFLDLAKDEPKLQKLVFIECLKYGVVEVLKNVAREERAKCKEAFAHRLHAEDGREVELYRQAINIICEVLFRNAIESTEDKYKDSRDGKVYKTVKIGNHMWMAENLNYKINDSWCYDDDETNGEKYGRLYTWDAAIKACPVGWHMSTRQEWDELVTVAGGSSVAGKKLKTTTGWINDNGARNIATDEFGFSALPGGGRDSFGRFGYVGSCGGWWTATDDDGYEAYYRYMGFNYVDGGGDYFRDNKCCGYSVRCVKNMREFDE